ncbi:MAG: hypothetical protein M4579_006840 [Chaenotheca gracillima]|nr:MAG: hypothetical protein M4579_006840 [Chaenotheca gracillima]
MKSANDPSTPEGGAPSASTDPSTMLSPEHNTQASSPPRPGWITKHDRHKQLINSSVYAKEMQVRARDLEETRKVRAQRRDEREKQKISTYLARSGGLERDARATKVDPRSGSSPELVIDGIRFQVTNGGSRLAKLPDDLNSAKTTPKDVMVGGVKFLRSKHGNLYRSGVVKAKRPGGAMKKINEPCERFTRTGIFVSTPNLYVTTVPCSCSKGPLCPYQHDPSKVGICKDFLQNGTCPTGDACDLSHDPTPERVPACLHFLRGKCSNPNCRYAHVRVNPGAPVCASFAKVGFCGKGAECLERHVHECPDYANKGSCGNLKCRLPHIDRAGQIRKTATGGTGGQVDVAAGKEDAGDVASDISSDEDDELGSDDVDSDNLEEDYMDVPKDPDTHNISQQDDFVHF